MLLAKNLYFDKSASIAFDWSNAKMDTSCRAAPPKPLYKQKRNRHSFACSFRFSNEMCYAHEMIALQS